MIRFASWIGGDRDGNPNVTPAVTLQTLAALHDAARRVYRAEVAHLRDQLTQDTDEIGVSDGLRESFKPLPKSLPASGEGLDPARSQGGEVVLPLFAAPGVLQYAPTFTASFTARLST